MQTLILALFGAWCGHMTIWSAVKFCESIEERVQSILQSVVVDVILLALFALYGNGASFTMLLIFKYIFLAAVNFDKTLRQ
jgi:hypothetical protein